VEDHVERIGEQLLPLLDRCNRMMLRNLKALQALREPLPPSVSIGAAGQVNVAGKQVNAASDEGCKAERESGTCGGQRRGSGTERRG
jgi:hypothetical protein